MEKNLLIKYAELSDQLQDKLMAIHVKINNSQEHLSDVEDAEDIAEIRNKLKE